MGAGELGIIIPPRRGGYHLYNLLPPTSGRADPEPWFADAMEEDA